VHPLPRITTQTRSCSPGECSGAGGEHAAVGAQCGTVGGRGQRAGEVGREVAADRESGACPRQWLPQAEPSAGQPLVSPPGGNRASCKTRPVSCTGDGAQVDGPAVAARRVITNLDDRPVEGLSRQSVPPKRRQSSMRLHRSWSRRQSRRARLRGARESRAMPHCARGAARSLLPTRTPTRT